MQGWRAGGSKLRVNRSFDTLIAVSYAGLEATFQTLNPKPSIQGLPVASSWLSEKQTFGFVEFRSEEEATLGLQLNGVVILNRTLKVGAPNPPPHQKRRARAI